MITLLPHSRRIGYRAKRKPSWKKLREFVNEQLKLENAIVAGRKKAATTNEGERL